MVKFISILLVSISTLVLCQDSLNHNLSTFPKSDELLKDPFVSSGDGAFRGFAWGSQKELIQEVENSRSIFLAEFNEQPSGLLYETKVHGKEAYVSFYLSPKSELIYSSYLFKPHSEKIEDYSTDLLIVNNILTRLYGEATLNIGLTQVFETTTTFILHSLEKKDQRVYHKILYMSKDYYQQTQINKVSE